MNEMYFGTREFMQWILCPKINMPRTKQGFSSVSQMLHGGAEVYRSLSGARRYEMEWPLRTGGRVDVIHAYAEGAYGDGPFFFLDPQAAKDNILPSHLSNAWLASEDGVNLAGKFADRPTTTPNVILDYKYPVKSAVYTLSGAETTLETWIPVPDGYSLHLGAHGSATGTAAVAYETDNALSGTLSLLSTNTPTRVNTTLTNTDGGVTIRLEGTGTLTLNSVIGVVLKDGKTPATGDWSPGKGHSGCEFDGFPTDTLYSLPFDMQATSAKFVEVGAWR